MSDEPGKNIGGFINSPGGVGYRRWNWLLRWMPASRDIWTRIGLLLGILCLVKVLVLVALRKQLFEEHWRVDSDIGDWTNQVAFFAFALLVGVNIWTFGTRCRTLSARAIHVANAFILLAGFLFILFNFHSGDESYLYLLLHKVLRLENIGWNLRLVFFFQWPFLGGWIFVYAFLYYILARTGRGSFIIQVTAFFAAAYIALCLADLEQRRDALVLTDCLGLAAFLTARRGRAVSWKWALLPWFSVLLLYTLFYGFTEQLSHPNTEFALLVIMTTVLFALMTLAARRFGFYANWTWLAAFSFFGFLLLINNYYVPSANYDQFLGLGLGMPRYFLGEFTIALVLLIIAAIYRKIHPRGKLWWLDALNLVLFTLALLDLKLSQTMSVRLDCNLLAFGDSPKMMWRLAQPYLPAAFGGVLVLVAFYFISLWLINRWQPRMRTATSGTQWEKGGLLFALTFTFLGLASSRIETRDKAIGQTVFLLVKTSSLWSTSEYKVMDSASLDRKVDELGITLSSRANLTRLVQTRRNLNVVLIFQESTYNKYLSLFGATNCDTEPLLSGYKDRMEIFPNFFSSFAGSIYARFATFTGLYPVGDFHAFTLERVGAKSIFEAMHDEGYSCSLFYSSFFDYTSFRDFLRNRGLDEMYDADTMPGQRKTESVIWGLREEETLGAMQARIKKYAADKQKFFMTYIPAAPHNPFDAIPDKFRQYKMSEFGNYEPNYINQLTYMDWVITSVLDELKTNGLLDSTLVVITADHGEMLGIHGGPIGHGWVVTPELANVPLIILDPAKKGYRINNTIGSEIDLFPTMMGILGLPLPTQNLYQGISLYDAPPEVATNRLIYLNSLRQYAIIQGNKIICGDRESETHESAPFRKTYEISNDGTRTDFHEIGDGPVSSVPLILPFSSFQENFLHNYLRYCQMVWGNPSDAK